MSSFVRTREPRRGQAQTFLERAAFVLAWAALVLTALSFAASVFSPRWMFAAIGFAGLFAVTWPFLIPRFCTMRELVSPWGFLVAGVFIGVTVRGVYMAIGWPDEGTLDWMFFRSQQPSFFYGPGAVLVISLALTSIGYFTASQRRSKPSRLVRYFEGYRMDPKRLQVVVGLLAFVGFLAFLRFAQETGGLDLLAPSRKRAVSPGLEIAADHRGLGYLRLAGTVAGIAYLLLLAHFGATRRRMLPWRLPLLAALFLNASLVAVYASSRADIAWLLLLSLAILFLVGRRVSAPAATAVVVLTLVIIQVMGLFRSVGGELEAVDLETQGSILAATDALIISRNLIDVSKTAHIMDAVPEVLDWRYGATITNWLVAPIPRELWPSKPGVQAGPEVGILVYGNKRSGVPPGFVAEMYWNFHLFGVFIGSPLFGFMLRRFHYHLYPRDPANVAWMLLYVVGTLRLGVFVFGTSTGHGIANAMLDIFIAALVLWLVGDRTHWRPRYARASLATPSRKSA